MTSTTAAECTGLVTEAGKAKMRDNALRHGPPSKHVVIKGEDAEEYEVLRHDLLDDWKPANTQEEMLVAQIAESAWHLMRVHRVETRTYDNDILVAEKLNAAGIAKCSPHPDGQLTQCFHSSSEQSDHIRRYETTIERSYYRAITELRKLQKERRKTELESVSQKPAAPIRPPPPQRNRARQQAALHGDRKCRSAGEKAHIPSVSIVENGARRQAFAVLNCTSEIRERGRPQGCSLGHFYFAPSHGDRKLPTRALALQ